MDDWRLIVFGIGPLIALFIFIWKNAPMDHTIEDMEKFWGAKFDGTSFVDPREVGELDNSFLSRFKRRALTKRLGRHVSDKAPGRGPGRPT